MGDVYRLLMIMMYYCLILHGKGYNPTMLSSLSLFGPNYYVSTGITHHANNVTLHGRLKFFFYKSSSVLTYLTIVLILSMCPLVDILS